MAQKKKSGNKLPKKVKPVDLTPGGFGSRVIRGIAGTLREAGKKKKK